MSKNKSIEEYLNQYNHVKGLTYIVTGANCGLGYSVCKHLLKLGGHVVMACRSLEKAKKAKIRLLELTPDAKISIEQYDQADFKSIDKFVLQIKNKYIDFNGLVLNAGIYHPKKGLKTKDGFPITIGTNYLGVYYLLKHLMDLGIWNEEIKRRIVFVGSLSCSKINHSQIEEILTSKRSYPIKEYAQSKTLLGSLAYELTKHQSDILIIPKRIKILFMHPGVTSTNIVGSKDSSYPHWFSKLAKRVLNIFVHSPDKAALGIIELLFIKEVDEDKILVPKGLFNITGYPINKNYSSNLKMLGPSLIKISQKIISETNY
ncbi:MAG: SDR family NAD(P)-dependent oxidoreductase [Tenericutes bacterium]|jgi:NAD(P)-dependent dehydrogenase (short-subunit alcohol dehydrogenase family)|nr:SDR family NAD(P)-dependent oxidoreductase [Mycoplasmatota bacterium]